MVNMMKQFKNDTIITGGTNNCDDFIIQAHEAYDKSKKIADAVTSNELKPIFDAIRKACEHGDFSILYKKDLSEYSVHRLRHFGYSVDIEYDGYYISWGEAEDSKIKK